MRYLIILPKLDKEIGGMERFVIEISKCLDESGHSVEIFTGTSPNPISIPNVKIIRVGIFTPRLFNKAVKYLQLSYKARTHLKKNKYDAVMAMGFSGFFLEHFIWRVSGSPVPITYQRQKRLTTSLFSKIYLELDKISQQIMERRCFRKADRHMFAALAIKSLFEKTYGHKPKNYFIPCSGTGTAVKGNNTKVLEWYKLEGYVKILTVRGLTQGIKGSDLLKESMPKLNFEKTRLIVIGKINIKLDKAMHDSIIHLENVDYSDMPSIYRNCDIFLLTSLSEGFPNVLLEAANYGLPTISTRIDGIHEYFKEGREILLISNDSKELIEKIGLLVHSKKKRSELSRNIKKRARVFNYELFTRKFIEFTRSENMSFNLLEE